MQRFIFSIVITIIGIICAFLWGGFQGFVLVLFLGTMEVSLSFDNAIINAQILKKMSEAWQKYFLNFGILISVFIVRFILPALLISFTAKLGFVETIHLALKHPDNYAKHLENAHISLSVFGGIFLWMAFITFFLDNEREIHWLKIIERKTTQFGKYKFIDVLLGVTILFIMCLLIPIEHQTEAAASGIMAIFLFLLLRAITFILSKNAAQHHNLGAFLYLETMDAVFSFDGVISAFAITNDLIIILLGLTMGAVFVRSLTLFFVQRRMLQKYLYLEHGAHYAIGALAILLLAGTITTIPEIIPGLVSVIIIAISFGASYVSARKTSRKI